MGLPGQDFLPTYDVERDVVVDGGRLSEVHPADVVPAVEALHPGHTGRRRAATMRTR